MKLKLLVILLLGSLNLFVASCQDTKSTTVDIPSTTNNSVVQNNIKTSDRVTIKNNLTTKVKFKRANGTAVFSLKPKANGIKVENAAGEEIARLTVDSDRQIKIKNPADQTLGYVVSKSDYWKLENADRTKELYILRKQTDGDYKLETAKNKPIYRLKRRNYGWEIETPQNQSLYKVKTKANKIALRDSRDNIVMETKSNFSVLAVACFGFDALNQEQQAALAYAVSLAGE